MTKAQLKRRIKSSLVAAIFVILFSWVPALLTTLMDAHKFDSSFGESFLSTNKIAIILGLTAIAIIDIGAVIKFISHSISTRVNKIKTNIYIRDINTDIPPAMASLLLDEKVEAEKDYTATVAYLIYKKYFKLINDNEILQLNNDTSSLTKHEKYVYNCITQKDCFEERKFVRLMHEEAENLGYIKYARLLEGVVKELFIILVTLIFFGALYYMSLLTEKYVGFIVPLWTIPLIIYFIHILLKLAKFTYYGVAKKFYTTKKGEKAAILFSAVKKFLHEYTYMEDQTIDGMVIYEKYIPYAIALGEADRIEEDVGTKYRYLVFRRMEKE